MDANNYTSRLVDSENLQQKAVTNNIFPLLLVKEIFEYFRLSKELDEEEYSFYHMVYLYVIEESLKCTKNIVPERDIRYELGARVAQVMTEMNPLEYRIAIDGYKPEMNSFENKIVMDEFRYEIVKIYNPSKENPLTPYPYIVVPIDNIVKHLLKQLHKRLMDQKKILNLLPDNELRKYYPKDKYTEEEFKGIKDGIHLLTKWFFDSLKKIEEKKG